ncbi:hypothetical protein ACSBLW_10690 [Thioclava sp. FR2]|uniref:hypothetical protein n=1 Tax=Thioclava sp. FR2 TaxID=3445780 RepID=UPI003EBF5187
MFNLLFRSSWKVQAFLAVVLMALAFIVNEAAKKDEAEKARALRDGIPQAVSLNGFDPKRDIHAAREVHVIGWINPDFNYQLTETTKTKRGSYDTVRRMFVLLGPDDAPDAKLARAVVLLPESGVESFLDDMGANVEDIAGERLVFRLNGKADRSPDLKNMAEDALGKLGVKKAPGFQYIEPWGMQGREAALAPDPDFGPTATMILGGLAGLFLLIAVAKLRRKPAQLPVEEPKTAIAPHMMDAVGADPAAVTTTLDPVAPKRPRSRKGLWILAGLGGVVAFVWAGGMFLMPLVVMAVFFVGLLQTKKALGRGMTAAVSRVSGKPAESALEAEVPAKSGEKTGGLAALAQTLMPRKPAATPGGAKKFLPLALGLGVLAVSSGGSLDGLFATQGLTPRSAAAVTSKEVPAAAPVEATVATVKAEPAVQAEAVPVQPSAEMAPAAERAAPAPAVVEAPIPAPVASSPAPVAASLSPFGAVPLGMMLAAVLVLGLGGVLFLRKQGTGLGRGVARAAGEGWDALERMVERERAIAARRGNMAQMVVQS